jgi:hypothetical protein
VLYRGIGETVVDKPTLGLYFRKTPSVPVSQLVLQPTGGPASSTTDIQKVGAELRVPADSRLLSMRVDMVPGAKSIEIKTRRPDGGVQVLLLIKEYPQQWQTPFVFRQPIPVPKDSLIQATAYVESKTVADSRPRFTVTFHQVTDLKAKS